MSNVRLILVLLGKAFWVMKILTVAAVVGVLAWGLRFGVDRSHLREGWIACQAKNSWIGAGIGVLLFEVLISAFGETR